MADAEAKLELLPQPQLERRPTSVGYELIVGIERGMIFWGEVLEEEHRDAEQFHERSTPCPWVIISGNVVHRRLPLVIAAPLTSKVHKANDDLFRQYRIRLPAATRQRYQLRAGSTALRDEESLVLTEQTRAMAHARLIGDPVGWLDARMMAAVEAGAKAAMEFA